MVGRPKEFDQQEALERAMRVFWTYGYEATSVQNLLDAMGINRGSMYDTFGDKHALFTAAVDHYGKTVTTGLEATLDAKGSPLGNVRKTLRAMCDQALVGNGTCKGCMATHIAVELAPHDPVVAKAVKGLLDRIEQAFHRALKRAVAEGELSPAADVRAFARFFTATVQGLVVMGKTSPGKSVMRDIAGVAISVLE